MTRLTGIRQHLRVDLPDGPIELWTKPFDYHLYGVTAKKHEWPAHDEDPVGYLLFLAWSSARRGGQIEATLTFEKFMELVDDVADLGTEPVDPTQAAAGAG